MNVSDGFLLTVAEVSAALIGLFLVGMVFYVQTGFRRLERSRAVVEPYFRASTRIVLIVYSVPLAISLTLVALTPGWSQILFWALVVALLLANVDTVGGLRPVMRATGSRLLLYNEIVGTIGVIALIVVTLSLGGLTPGREDLAPAILLALGLGFLSTCVLVLTLFDISEFERSEDRPQERRGPPKKWWSLSLSDRDAADELEEPAEERGSGDGSNTQLEED